MSQLECRVVRTVHELSEAVRTRWVVFAEEARLVVPNAGPLVGVEHDAFDLIDSTLHFVAYHGDEVIGAARLLLPNSRVANDNGLAFGLEMEDQFELDGAALKHERLAEPGRLCVRAAWQGTRAFVLLYKTMKEESLRRGITMWVGAANTNTDNRLDAAIAYRIAEQRGLTYPWGVIRARSGKSVDGLSETSLYDVAERNRAERCDLAGLRLPSTIALYARVGARYLPGIRYDRVFRRYAMPFVVELR